MIELTIKTEHRNEIIDITKLVSGVVADSGIDSGFVFCFVPHTTAAITINENADPDVKLDILTKLKHLFPKSDNYRHAEGNSDAHLKSSLIGFSEQIMIENGNLLLGMWQGILFCEFDGPRSRRLQIKVMSIAPD